jgi:hypothetical protein
MTQQSGEEGIDDQSLWHAIGREDRRPRPRGVLVASDAIGMGLNLNIRRVIFTAMRKYDGERTREKPQSIFLRR